MLRNIRSGICAGICICMGGTIFLSCDVRYAGALLFCVALLCICMKGYSLFTGKVGYLWEKHDRSAFSGLLLGLLGNAIATVIGGLLIRAAIPAVGTAAEAICTAKLSQGFFSALLRAVCCGILMYLAVSIWRERKTCAAILFCIPVFILSGFEHSVADLFYFAASGIVSVKAFGYLWLVILGNSIGALLLPALTGKEGT